MKKYFIVAILVLTTSIFYLFKELPSSQYAIVVFLDVGQGDSILFRSPDGGNILIDGGSGSTVLRRIASYLPFFDRQIDLLVLTHPHEDHVGGLIEVLKKYTVRNVLMSNKKYDDAFYNEFVSAVSSQESTVHFADPEISFGLGEFKIDVVYAGYEVNSSNINNHSIALMISYHDEIFYLGGDNESEVEEFILETGTSIDADVFKASHHGSKTANSYKFVSKISPSSVVIQCGENNKFGHPHDEVIDIFLRVNGIKNIYRTDVSGDVVFKLF